MISIFDILSSRARALALKALFSQGGAVPLRHIAYMSGLNVFSVQRALEALLGYGVIRRRDEGNYALFELDRDHPLYPLIAQFFTAEINCCIQAESRALGEKAKAALEFASSAVALLRHARMRAAGKRRRTG